MGLTKSEIFTDTQNRIAAFAKALGHPARVAILQQLFKTDSCICGDLVEEIGLAQPTISQHLRELKTLGLIQGSIEGTRVCYCIDKENWTLMKEMLVTFMDQDIPAQEGCC
ncbi:ArsR/SmtB family transcription factor [Robiginitalea sp.]|uniref:ArsR/SmtB family transcription factor n=1 Tax=Robiginitalea sp. TaxID=1902411 RepID=UPI003C49A1ED